MKPIHLFLFGYISIKFVSTHNKNSYMHNLFYVVFLFFFNGLK